MYTIAQALADRAQARQVALAPAPKRKILADPQLAQRQCLADPRHKLLCALRHHLAGERQDDQQVDTQLRDQLAALVDAGQVVPIALGMDHEIGVRVESQHRALVAERLCAPHRAADQMLMTTVDTVERADRQHGRALIDRLWEPLDKFHNYPEKKNKEQRIKGKHRERLADAYCCGAQEAIWGLLYHPLR